MYFSIFFGGFDWDFRLTRVENVGKSMLSVGAGGLGVGLVSGYLLGDDGHSKSDHGNRKEKGEK